MGLASKLASVQYQGQGQAPSQYGAPYGAPPQQPGGPAYYSGAPGAPPGAYSPGQGQYANPAQGGQQNKQGITTSFFNILKECVDENRLHEFYSLEQLQHIANSIVSSGVDPIAQVCAKWNIIPELAFDLVKLALYDTVFLVDDSGSIKFNQLERELKDLLEAAAFATSLFDRDGISVQFFHSHEQGHNITGGDSVRNLIDRVTFARDTPLAGATQQKILAPTLAKYTSRQLRKPVHLIIITDGVPTDNASNEFQTYISRANAIMNANGKKLLSIQIAQVGTDKAAAQFLQELDTDRIIGKMIDCTSNFELESEQCQKKGFQIGRSEWYCKLLMGAIDKSYDSNDEGKAPAPSASSAPYNAPSQYSGSQYGQQGYPPPQQQQYQGAPQGGQQPYGANTYPQQGQAPYQQAPPPHNQYAPQAGYGHQQAPPPQGQYAPQGQYPQQQAPRPQGAYPQQQPPPGQYQQPGVQGQYPQQQTPYGGQGAYPYAQAPQGQYQGQPQGQAQYNAQGQPAYGAAAQQQGNYYGGSAPPATYNPGNQYKTSR